MSDVQVDGKVEPISQIRVQHEHAFRQSAGHKGVDERGDVNLTACRVQRVERYARGELNVTQTVCVGIILHLGRNEREGIFVPVRAGDGAAVDFVQYFTRFVIGEGRAQREQVAGAVLNGAEHKSAIGNNIAQI